MTLFSERAELAFDIVPHIAEMTGMGEYAASISKMKELLRGIQGGIGGPGAIAGAGGGSVAGRIAGAATTAGVAGAAAVLGFGALSVQDAVQTERVADRIIAAHDKVRVHQDQFRKWIEDNTVDLRTSMKDLWTGIGDTIGQNFGVRGTEVVTSGVAKMSKLLGGEFTTTIKNVTQMLSAMHVTAKQLPATMDALYAAAQKSTQGNAFFNEGTQRFLVQAGATGMSNQQALGLAAEIGRMGVGSRATSAFGGLLDRMMKLNADPRYANIVNMGQYGFYGSLDRILNAPGSSLAQQQQLLGGGLAFNIAQRVAAAGPGGLSLGPTAGGLDRGFKRYADSASGDMDKLTASVNKLKDTFGEGLIPVLEDAASRIAGVVEKAQTITDTFPGGSKAITETALALGVASVAFKGLSAVYGPLLGLLDQARKRWLGQAGAEGAATVAEGAEGAAATTLTGELVALNEQLVLLNRTMAVGAPELGAEAAGIRAVGVAALTADPEVASLVANLEGVQAATTGTAAVIDAEALAIGGLGVASGGALATVSALVKALAAVAAGVAIARRVSEKPLTGAPPLGVGQAEVSRLYPGSVDVEGHWVQVSTAYSAGQREADVAAWLASHGYTKSKDVLGGTIYRLTGESGGYSSKSSMFAGAAGSQLNRITLPPAVANWAQPLTKYGQQYHIPASVLAAMVYGESSGHPDAVSPLGSQYGEGLMMLSKQAAQQIGGAWASNVRDVTPGEQIQGGAAYLRYLLNHNAHGDLRTAMIMYIAGPNTKPGTWAWTQSARYVDTVEWPRISSYSQGTTRGPTAAQSNLNPATRRPSGLFGFQETGFIPGELTADMAGVKDPRTGAWGTANEHWDIDAPAGTKVYMIGDRSFRCQCIGVITNKVDGNPLISLETLPDGYPFTLAHLAWKGLRVKPGSVIHGGDFIGYLAVEPKLGSHLHVAVTWGAERAMMAHTPKANWVQTQGSTASGYGAQEGPGGASVYHPAAGSVDRLGYVPLPVSGPQAGTLKWWEARLSTDQQNFSAIFGGVDPAKLKGQEKADYVSWIRGVAQDKYEVALKTIQAQTWLTPAQKSRQIADARKIRDATDAHPIAYPPSQDRLNRVVGRESYDLQTLQTLWSGADPTKLSRSNQQAWLHDTYRMDELSRQIADNSAKIQFHAHIITLAQLNARLAADNEAKNRQNQQARSQLASGGLGPAGGVVGFEVTGRCEAEARANVIRHKTQTAAQAAAKAGKSTATGVEDIVKLLTKQHKDLKAWTDAVVRSAGRGPSASTNAKLRGVPRVPSNHL